MSYCRDAAGKALAHTVATQLSAAGFKVTWDKEIHDTNPASIVEWMHETFEKADVVLMILSPEYLRRFGNSDGTDAHLGVLFESRILMRRYYNHSYPDQCPLLPVADLTLTVDSAPCVLQSLPFSRVDPVTGEGIEALCGRIEAIYRKVADRQGAAPMNPAPQRGDPGVGRVVWEMDTAVPSSRDAVGLVNRWLSYDCAPDTCPAEFVRGFPAAQRIIKAAGDLELMGKVVDACLRQLGTGRLIEQDERLKASILIDGRGWYLRMSGQLLAAVAAVEEGIDLADNATRARGWRDLAQIYRQRAEIAQVDQAVDLDRAELYVNRALEYFEHESRAGIEEAATKHVLARVKHARFRLLGKRRELRSAASLAEEAVGMFLPDRAREEIELQLLRCEIAIDKHKVAVAEPCLNRTIELLSQHGEQGASYRLLWARAYEAKAALTWQHRTAFGWRVDGSTRVAASQMAEQALTIYRSMEQKISAAWCEWFLVRIDPRSARLCAREVRLLDRKLRDPRKRLAAAAEFGRHVRDGDVNFLRRQRILRQIIQRLAKD